MKDSLEAEQKSKMKRAAEILGRKAEGIRSYEVVHEPKEKQGLPRNPILEPWIFEPEYERAIKLKERLIHDFEGTPLEKAVPGKVVANEYGESYCIEGECFTQFRKPDYEKSRQAIIPDLKLVYGIGPIWEGKLKRQGFLTIEDLTKHPKWQRPANQFLEMIERSDVGLLQRWLGRFLPKSHPLAHYLAGFLRDEDFAILDIETLGLFGRAIILLGIAKPSRNAACINQYLLRDIPEEPASLWEFVSHLEDNEALITFNGRTFDVPFIQERLSFYGMEAPLSNPHFDLLHFARRAWRDNLPDCRLGTVEKYLGVQRNIEVPSALVPEFYETYLKTQNVGPLVAVVEHNKQDLLTLATLFSKLYEVWNI